MTGFTVKVAESVLKAAQQGEVSAFHQIYLLYASKVLRLTSGILGSQEEGRDLTQDIFIKVFAKLPESDAAKAGIKSADIIKEINGQEINNDSLSTILAKINDMQDGEKLTIQVQRGNKLVMLKGSVIRQKIPGWRLQIMPQHDVTENVTIPTGCGYVSVFNNPAISMNRHAVKINEIKAVGFSSGLFYEPRNEVIKVPTGDIEITVQEHIRSEIISRYRNDLLVRNKNAVKVFTLTVEPNKVYHLAAEYFANPSERKSKDDYWQPIVWKTTERSCE